MAPARKTKQRRENWRKKFLGKEEINKYKRAFAIFDVEGDGTITAEVKKFLHVDKLTNITT